MIKTKTNNKKDEISELDELIKTTPKSKKVEEETSKTPETRRNSNEWLKSENKRLASEVSRLRKELVNKTEELKGSNKPTGNVDVKVERLFNVFLSNFLGRNRAGRPYDTVMMVHRTKQGVIDEFVKEFPELKSKIPSNEFTKRLKQFGM